MTLSNRYPRRVTFESSLEFIPFRVDPIEKGRQWHATVAVLDHVYPFTLRQVFSQRGAYSESHSCLMISSLTNQTSMAYVAFGIRTFRLIKL